MKKKTARRWLNRNKWKIAVLRPEHYNTESQFHKQLLKCLSLTKKGA